MEKLRQNLEIEASKSPPAKLLAQAIMKVNAIVQDSVGFEPRDLASVIEVLPEYHAAMQLSKLSVDQAAETLVSFSSLDKRYLVINKIEELSIEMDNPTFSRDLIETLEKL